MAYVKNTQDSGTLGTTSKPSKDWSSPEKQCKLVNGKVHTLHKVVVHRFLVDNVEDPDLHAAHPLWEWENSEAGKWAMAHSVEVPIWHRMANHLTFNTEYIIVAILADKDHTFWQLKWGSK